MKRFLLSIIGVLVFAISLNARTYTHTFKDGDLTTKGGVVKLTDIEWNSLEVKEIKWSDDFGIQIGSGTNFCEEYSLKTSAFKDCIITSVTVYSSVGNKGETKLTIKVGDKTSDPFELGGDITKCTFNDFRVEGDIEINWVSTKKHYYINKIEIMYELPASAVSVPKPVFTTAEGVYEKEILVVAETSITNDTLYYTIDGTIPSYKEYHSNPRVGTTKRSGYSVINETLKNSATIKAIAIRVDGESVYQSDVVEAKYIISETKPYIPVQQVATGNKYAFIAKDGVADFLFGATEGYMQNRDISAIYDKYIETVAYSAFTFTSTDGGYTIQDAEERYMYIANNDGKVSFTTEKPTTGAVWSVTIDNDSKATIKNGDNTLYYDGDNNIFGCYATAGDNMELPSLYMQCEYPKAVITPEDGSYVQGLKEFTIYCEKGISVSDDFSLKAQSGQNENREYEIDKTYECTQIDENTLKFTIDEDLVSVANINIDLIITGDIYLNPESMAYPIPIKGRYTRSICSYTHIGYAPVATIDSISPASEEKVETLSYILFQFSDIATNINEAKKITVYREETNDTIATSFTFINLNENGQLLKQNQGALTIGTPITKNGTYIIEIPDGYFVDRNSKEIKGVTLKYIVENATDIENIVVEGNTDCAVYNLTGIKVLDADNTDKLNTLPKGIYIINGKKVLVK